MQRNCQGGLFSLQAQDLLSITTLNLLEYFFESIPDTARLIDARRTRPSPFNAKWNDAPPSREIFITTTPRSPITQPTTLAIVSFSYLNRRLARMMEKNPDVPERIVPVTPLVCASPT